MARDAHDVNAYLHEFWDEAEEKPCPGCGHGFTDMLRSKGGRERIHSSDCDYLRWIDEEDMRQ